MHAAIIASDILFFGLLAFAMILALAATHRAFLRRSLRVPGRLYTVTYTPPDVRGKGLAFSGDTLTEHEVQGASLALAEFLYSVRKMVRA
jgi:hypothetical protein